MSNLLQKIKTILLGPKTGMTLSSSAPEKDPNEPKSAFMSKPRPVHFSSEPVDPQGHRRPDGDGWVWKNGEWSRPVRGISGGGAILDDEADETPRPGQRFRVIPSEFYRRNDRD